MRPVLRVVLIGGIGILAFDALASVGSRVLGFPYGVAAIGSMLIWALVGAAAAEGARHGPVIAGAMVGFIEATAGWAISWMIGPGRPPAGTDSISGRIFTICFVTALAAGVGAAAGALRRRRRARRSEPARTA